MNDIDVTALAIGRVASGIAHDFNNVLNGIVAYGEMLLEDAPDARRQRYAQNVLTAAGRGRELVEQILSPTRNLRGKAEPTDVCSTVSEALELLRGSVPASVTLESSTPDAAILVMGSATQLHRVVMNLCHNSLQAVDAEGTVRVAVEPQGRCVCLRVEDDGCGMDQATLARIFQAGFTTKERGRGTGLGLSLVYAIVTNLGGAIDVTSAPGEGSTFSIYLPITNRRGHP
jgi:signal transduction histidine kinase